MGECLKHAFWEEVKWKLVLHVRNHLWGVEKKKKEKKWHWTIKVGAFYTD